MYLFTLSEHRKYKIIERGNELESNEKPLLEGDRYMITFKRKLAHFYMHYMYRKHYFPEKTKEAAFDQLLMSNIEADIDLVTIAFENPYVIEMQIKLINKNINDKFNYFVVDNSVNIEKSLRIKEICELNKVNYIKLPNNPFNGKYPMPSCSNGAAMNYFFHNYLKNSETRYFGFIDHDIFPFKKCSIVANLEKQAFWGVLRSVPTKNSYCCLYPWAGFCFFDKQKFELEKFDFMPQKGYGDTGAKNFKKLFVPIISTDAFLEYSFASFKRINIPDMNGSPQSSQYELIDESWIHYLNASNWTNEDLTQKSEYLNNILIKYLGENDK